MLDKREKERDEAQRSWQSLEQIKDLKEGYLSQIIHELTQLVIKYNAIICLEDLNSGFMHGRQKVDKSVYQQFEQRLIKKLQYLVDKKAAPDGPLGVLRGAQLTNEDVSLKGKQQNGIIFYIPAWCTSKIDPVTGFVNLFDSRTMQWENIAKARAFFSKFDAIRYNAADDLFEFDFDYSKFGGNAEGTRTKWTVCSYGNRIKSFRNPAKQNHWDDEEINLTAEFKNLFREYGINLKRSLPEQINAQPDEQKFWKNLLFLFKMTLQLRNSRANSADRQDDYILSPVRGKDGSFFDSRKADGSLPQDADANGAYNIARKGLWLLQQIRKADNIEKVNLAMTKKDWLNFVQDC